MNRTIYILAASLLLTLGLGACQNDAEPQASPQLRLTFTHPDAPSRATETAFEPGDCVGLFVADASRPLEIGGNTANNEPLTFDGSAWAAQQALAWDTLTYNLFAYYPYQPTIGSVTDMPFAVRLDQSADGAYEASDFLHALRRGVRGSNERVEMQFRHIMSKLSVRLIKGEDYDGEIPDDVEVFIHNVADQATIDLEGGAASIVTRAPKSTIKARKESPARHSAIIVPQRIANRVPLIEIITSDISFLYESRFLFKPGVHHVVNVVIDKNPEDIKIEIGGEVVDWS